MPVFRGEAELSELPSILSQHFEQVGGVSVGQAQAFGRFRYIVLDVQQKHYQSRVVGYTTFYDYERLNLHEVYIYGADGVDLRSVAVPLSLYTTGGSVGWPTNKLGLLDGDTVATAVSVGIHGSTSSPTTYYTRICFDLGEPRYIRSVSRVTSAGRGSTVRLLGLPEGFAYADPVSVFPLFGVPLGSSSTVGHFVVTPYYEAMFFPDQAVLGSMVVTPFLVYGGLFYGPSRLVRYVLRAERTHMILALRGLPHVAERSYNAVYFVGRALSPDGKLSGASIIASTYMPSSMSVGRALTEHGASWNQPVSLFSAVARDLHQICLQQLAYASSSGTPIYFLPDLYVARISSGLVLDWEEIFDRNGNQYLLIENPGVPSSSYTNAFTSSTQDTYLAVRLN